MSTYRNCSFSRSDEPDVFWVVRPHKGDFNPDKHANLFNYGDCSFGWTRKNGVKVYKVTHNPTGNIYYGVFDNE